LANVRSASATSVWSAASTANPTGAGHPFRRYRQSMLPSRALANVRSRGLAGGEHEEPDRRGPTFPGGAPK
jgi:hypothetical protein